MSTRSEPTENGKSTETSQDTKKEIYSLLKDFNVLRPGLDRVIFKCIYIFLIGNLFLLELLNIPEFLLSNSSFPIGLFLFRSGSEVLMTVCFISVVWRFNVWREDTSKTLRHLIEKKRIYVPDRDVNKPYLCFLEHYRDALASRKRYFPSILLMVPVVNLHVYLIVQDISIRQPVGHPNVLVTLLAVVTDLIDVSILLAGVYCVGIVIYAIYISGRYIRKLVQEFELRIQPFHTDMCGGLKVLGNFCFGLVSPILIGSGLLIGYILLLLSSPKPQSGGEVVEPLVLGFALFVLLLIALPVVIFAFILPLRDIHSEMVSEGETDEDAYNARMGALREEIQSLLNTNQVEAAKSVQEKKSVLETLHTPYPTWPFHFRSKLFSTVLGVGGSLIIGVITAALQQYILPAILKLLFHTS